MTLCENSRIFVILLCIEEGEEEKIGIDSSAKIKLNKNKIIILIE
jgi:hypothetical protein